MYGYGSDSGRKVSKGAELRPLRASTLEYVRKQFADAAGAAGAAWRVDGAEQVVLDAAMTDAFERERTRLGTRGVARPLTKTLWTAPPDDRYAHTLTHGFFGGYTGSALAVTFWESPVAALDAGRQQQRERGRAPAHVLQCRVTLGREGQDYTVTHAGPQKDVAYVLRTPLAVPAFALTVAPQAAGASAASPSCAPVREVRVVEARPAPKPTPVAVECRVTQATAMAICPHCFETCLAGARFCSACGARIDEQQQ